MNTQLKATKDLKISISHPVLQYLIQNDVKVKLNWQRIYAKFELSFSETYKISKKAHFDSLPEEWAAEDRVVDGARVKWCIPVLLDAMLYFHTSDHFDLSYRRNFNQAKVLLEAIIDEIGEVHVELHDFIRQYSVYRKKSPESVFSSDSSPSSDLSESLLQSDNQTMTAIPAIREEADTDEGDAQEIVKIKAEPQTNDIIANDAGTNETTRMQNEEGRESESAKNTNKLPETLSPNYTSEMAKLAEHLVIEPLGTPWDNLSLLAHNMLSEPTNKSRKKFLRIIHALTCHPILLHYTSTNPTTTTVAATSTENTISNSTIGRSTRTRSTRATVNTQAEEEDGEEDEDEVTMLEPSLTAALQGEGQGMAEMINVMIHRALFLFLSFSLPQDAYHFPSATTTGTAMRNNKSTQRTRGVHQNASTLQPTITTRRSRHQSSTSSSTSVNENSLPRLLQSVQQSSSAPGSGSGRKAKKITTNTTKSNKGKGKDSKGRNPDYCLASELDDDLDDYDDDEERDHYEDANTYDDLEIEEDEEDEEWQKSNRKSSSKYSEKKSQPRRNSHKGSIKSYKDQVQSPGRSQSHNQSQSPGKGTKRKELPEESLFLMEDEICFDHDHSQPKKKVKKHENHNMHCPHHQMKAEKKMSYNNNSIGTHSPIGIIDNITSLSPLPLSSSITTSNIPPLHCIRSTTTLSTVSSLTYTTKTSFASSSSSTIGSSSILSKRKRSSHDHADEDEEADEVATTNRLIRKQSQGWWKQAYSEDDIDDEDLNTVEEGEEDEERSDSNTRRSTKKAKKSSSCLSTTTEDHLITNAVNHMHVHYAHTPLLLDNTTAATVTKHYANEEDTKCLLDFLAMEEELLAMTSTTGQTVHNHSNPMTLQTTNSTFIPLYPLLLPASSASSASPVITSLGNGCYPLSNVSPSNPPEGKLTGNICGDREYLLWDWLDKQHYFIAGGAASYAPDNNTSPVTVLHSTASSRDLNTTTNSMNNFTNK